MGEVDLSIIVIVHDMQREAPRTLRSLSRGYQRGVEQLRYEVLVVDNGSKAPLPAGLGGEFQYRYVQNAAVSPVAEINREAERARGKCIAVMVDGARLASPGLLYYAMLAQRLSADAVVGTLAWHLGPQVQHVSVREGYSQEVEDRMLEEIDWFNNGYRLFERSTLCGPCRRGWFAMPGESNCVFVARDLFTRIGGYDLRFTSPGGGLCNHDFYRRACDESRSSPILLLGEGTFHQLHGGKSTNTSGKEREALLERYHREYEQLRGEPFRRSQRAPVFFGHLPREAAGVTRMSADHLERFVRTGADAPPVPA